MKLIDKLNTECLTARKAKDSLKANLLITMKGQVENSLKSGNDIDSEKVINSVAKSIIKGLETVTQTEDTIREKEIASEYLPQLMNEDQLYEAIKAKNFVLTKETLGYNTGQIMKAFAGKIDGKMVKPILEKLMSESILRTDEDKEIFVNAIVNPPAPNEKLKAAQQANSDKFN